MAIACILSCKKDPLPKPTQTGANMMACRVNGEKWIAGDYLTTKGAPTGWYDKQNKVLNIYGKHIDKRLNRTITITVKNVAATGTYSLVNSPFSQGFCGIFDFRPDKYYYTDYQNSGSITFTRFDTVNRIYSGTFSFKATRYVATNVANSTDVIRITDGRFDVGQKK